MRANRMRRCGSAERYSDGIQLLKNPGDFVTIERGTPRSVLILCPDGCGETISVNLDKRSGPAWRRYERKETITLFPSVWKTDGCKAHFIVWNDKILWCDAFGAARSELVSEDWIATVFEALPREETDYQVLAEMLNVVPWDVSWACDELVRRRKALAGKKRGYYYKITVTDTKGRINIFV